MIGKRTGSALAALSASVLVACSSSSGAHGVASSRSTADSAPSSSPALTQPSEVPASVPNSVSIRQQANLSSCVSSKGGWTAGGTVKNPGNKARTFEITVFFTTNPGGTVQSFGSTKVTADARTTQVWSVMARFAAAPNTSCVLRGVA